VVSYAADSARSPCQDRIYEVRVLDESDAVDQEEHEAGTIPLAITAAGVDGDFSVTVDGQPAEVTGDYNVPDPGDGLTTFVVRTPAVQEGRTATVEVSTDRGSLHARVDLPGVDGAEPDASEVPSPTSSDAEPSPTESPGEPTEVESQPGPSEVGTLS
jgi:hypothetical protein